MVHGVSEIPLFYKNVPYLRPLTGRRKVYVGQFDWGGLRLKSNAGAQRFTWSGWKSDCKRKGICELDCKTYKSSRDESRS